MDLPEVLIGQMVNEGELYFFTTDCPVGIADHIHVCIRHANKVLLLSTCSSQIDTAMRIAQLHGYDMNTFPVFLKDDVNMFNKPQTYVNCNNVVELSDKDFGKIIKDGKVHKLNGHIDANGLKLIANGIKLSPDIEGRIKKMF